MKRIRFVIRFIKNLIQNTIIDIRSEEEDLITVDKVVNEDSIVYTITVKRKPKS